MEKVTSYEVGYSKGAFEMVLLLLDRAILNNQIFYDCRTKKKYQERLIEVLLLLAKDQPTRQKFMDTGIIEVWINDQGKITGAKE